MEAVQCESGKAGDMCLGMRLEARETVLWVVMGFKGWNEVMLCKEQGVRWQADSDSIHSI